MATPLSGAPFPPLLSRRGRQGDSSDGAAHETRRRAPPAPLCPSLWRVLRPRGGRDSRAGPGAGVQDPRRRGGRGDGKRGNDLIDGRAGNDDITGGKGRDVISGGAGNDTIRLGNDGERDIVSCGAGNKDVVRGADSKDVIDQNCETVRR
ncbi:MAG: hypothetical protein ACRDRH_09535 [Pseudonocardia sp.]